VVRAVRPITFGRVSIHFYFLFPDLVIEIYENENGEVWRRFGRGWLVSDNL